ncbi:MAG: hypothetical protein KAI17_17805 [Thiotrichaceae bacterium]|nr:hypothetical protein [Thiotrichaceae bacterium]
MSGKGDKQIKSQVSWQTYSDNWDNAFIYKNRDTQERKLLLEAGWDKVFGTSTSERIAGCLLEEDKVLCERLDNAADIQKQ